jgi:mRNA interferase MazF
VIQRGEIYLTNFGERVRGHEQRGIRPALIIQSDLGNASSETTIVASLTSREFAAVYPFHVPVSPDESGLREDSTVQLEQLQTLSMDRLGRRVGRLSPEKMLEVDVAIHRSLGLIH